VVLLSIVLCWNVSIDKGSLPPPPPSIQFVYTPTMERTFVVLLACSIRPGRLTGSSPVYPRALLAYHTEPECAPRRCSPSIYRTPRACRFSYGLDHEIAFVSSSRFKPVNTLYNSSSQEGDDGIKPRTRPSLDDPRSWSSKPD
jgi:hypothetical protein